MLAVGFHPTGRIFPILLEGFQVHWGRSAVVPTGSGVKGFGGLASHPQSSVGVQPAVGPFGQRHQFGEGGLQEGRYIELEAFAVI